ncbi:hypothetical protein GALMADRAFT_916592 [Galerina marginata CBS 339.88]|uniref:Uncharacterized protein n=1 Tax=Galerina marginata (strain CBS 339.88) TaxID=685588 RepID=A0A067SS50_GALM3|nr:hypothetical protein GALMADRAFT_916592 [Galerina marginata CBS 339.88]
MELRAAETRRIRLSMLSAYISWLAGVVLAPTANFEGEDKEANEREDENEAARPLLGVEDRFDHVVIDTRIASPAPRESVTALHAVPSASNLTTTQCASHEGSWSHGRAGTPAFLHWCDGVNTSTVSQAWS